MSLVVRPKSFSPYFSPSVAARAAAALLMEAGGVS